MDGYKANVPRTIGSARRKDVHAELLKYIQNMAKSDQHEKETQLHALRKKLQETTVERDQLTVDMSRLKSSNTTELNNMKQNLRKCNSRAAQCESDKCAVKKNLQALELQIEVSKKAKQLVDNAPPATLDAQYSKELEELKKKLEACQTDKKACSSNNTALDSQLVISEMNLARETKQLEVVMKKLAEAN